MNETAMLRATAVSSARPLKATENDYTTASAVAWTAIVAGVAGAAALSLILVVLGVSLCSRGNARIRVVSSDR